MVFIQDATNNDLNRATVDYMAEVFDLYLALQHANIPAEFIDEVDLSPQGLKPYRVLYVTEPNIPVEGQQGIVNWVRDGGTLCSISGAGQDDRYDEPCDVLSRATGIQEQPRSRMLFCISVTLLSRLTYSAISSVPSRLIPYRPCVSVHHTTSRLATLTAYLGSRRSDDEASGIQRPI